MPLGTCTSQFQKAFPDRFFDVGIAEEHAVTLCAGMASCGIRPFFFVYSTFLQRGYDQVLHDVCIQQLPVVFMLDRAGISNEDGQSHQGLYDYAYLRHIPGMTVLAPADANELEKMIQASVALNAPCSIRYPKNAEKLPDAYSISSFEVGKWQTLRKGGRAAVLAAGTMTAAALRVADGLAQEGIELEVINASSIKPLDNACLERVLDEFDMVFTVEEHVLQGGFGSAVLEWAAIHERYTPIIPLAIEDRFIQHGDHKHLLEEVGLDDAGIAASIRKHLKERVEKNG